MNELTSDGIIRLRAMEPSDIDIIYEWENDSRFWTVTDTVAPYSKQALREYVAAYRADIYSQRELRLIVTLASTGQSIGIVDFMNFDPLNNRAELGLLIAPSLQGQGYGERTIELVKKYAGEHIGLRQLYVFIRNDNTSCLALFDNHGFHRAGLLKNWVKRGKDYHDVVFMQFIF